VKLLKVEEQWTAVENGFLEWQGGIREPFTISPQEHVNFEIAKRHAAQGSPLVFGSYLGDNSMSHDLVAGHTYTITMAIYGDNVRTRTKTVVITVGTAADDIKLSSNVR
jgi:hypothetical protein